MTERDLTADEMSRAASFLLGASDEAERHHVSTVVLPLRTARAIARAILGAING